MIDEPYRWVEAISNRREYIENELATGSPTIGLSFSDGILLLTFGRDRRKIFEIYDPIAMGGIGHPGDLERLRMTAIELASTEGFTGSAADVSLRRMATYSFSPALKQAFEQIYDALFSRVPVLRDRIHAIPTEALTPEQAAASYQTMLQRYYGDKRLDADRPLFDVTLLGVGENGHTASLFPDSAALGEKRRWAVAVVGETPETCVTLTYPALESSRNVVFLVVGANKKGILERIRAGDNSIPAARVRPTGNLFWFVDKDAASG